MITATIITVLMALTVSPTAPDVFLEVNDLPAPIEALETEPEAPAVDAEPPTEAEYVEDAYWEPQYQETGVTGDYSEPNDYYWVESVVSYEMPSDGLNSFTGVNYHEGRTETFYSSQVLYHYRTSVWTLDDEGFYRDSEGRYVVAASDMEHGTVFQGSKGECIVLDTGCNAGITDYYVAW